MSTVPGDHRRGASSYWPLMASPSGRPQSAGCACFIRDLRFGPKSSLPRVLNRPRDAPRAPSAVRTASHGLSPRRLRGLTAHLPKLCSRLPSGREISRQERSASLSLRVRLSRSRWLPRESLDAPEDLPKERRRQVALRQLQDEVSGIADEPPAGLGTAAAAGSSASSSGWRAARPADARDCRGYRR
jgi:hypothetical protein